MSTWYQVQLFVMAEWRDYGIPIEIQAHAIHRFRVLEAKDPDGMYRVLKVAIIRPVFDKAVA